MIRTMQQNKALYSLISRLRIDDETKQSLVMQFTKGRTTHSSEMFQHECDQLIEALQAKLPQPKPRRAFVPKNELEAKKERQRKRIISHLKEAGYMLPDGRADMHAINLWVKKQKFKKTLNQHTSEELSQLIYAAGKVRDHFLKHI